MIDFLLHYGVIGVIFSLFLNITLWALHRPTLNGVETAACIILWPISLVSFINVINGVKEEIEEE